MNNILLLIATLIVMALSTLFAAPYFVDWNDYRHVFEKQTSRLIGRKVNVGGDVSLKFLPSPVLRFENVNVADEEGTFDEPFLSARSFSIWLSVPPLLRGAIEAREVELDEPVLNLKIGSDGKGNWRDVGRPDVTLPFVPRTVALDSVKISSATVRLARASGKPYIVLDNFGGELSARSLQGPFKFAGTFETGGGAREIRFSTARREGEGPLRLKAVVSDVEGLEFYSVDGNLSGLEAVPRFKGDFSAHFRDEPGPKEEAGDEAASLSVPVTVKAQLSAGLEQASFSALEITVRRSDKPQTITGEVDAAYSDGLVIEGNLSSRWVDFDLLTGSAPGAGPAAALEAIARAALSSAPIARKGRFALALEQAVLAGDLLGAVRLETLSEGSVVTIESLTAELPGQTKLNLKGTISDRDGAPAFKGDFSIGGEKPNRLLAWAGFPMQQIVAAKEGGFALEGALSLSPGAIALEEGVGQLFGSRFSGVLRYGLEGRRLLELTLKSEKLDITRMTGADAKPVSLPWLLKAFSGGPAEKGEAGAFSRLGAAEAHIDIDISALTLPGLGESGLEAGLHITGSDIDIRRLKLRSDTGLDLQANGNLASLDEKPHGNITLAADARSSDGVKALAGLLELDRILALSDARLGALAPAQLTAAVRSIGDEETGLALRMEGTLGGSDLTITASTDGALAKWRDSKIDLDGSIKSASSRHLLRQFFKPLSAADLDRLADDKGVFGLTLTGIPAQGMRGSAAMTSAGIDWVTTGTLTATETGFDFAGKSDLKAKDGIALLLLGGVRVAPGHRGEPVKVSSWVESSGGVYKFGDIDGSSGRENFSGSGRLDMSGAKPFIDLDILASAASLSFLLEPLIIWEADANGATGVVRGVTRSGAFWPEEMIDAALLSAFNAKFRLEAETLRLAGPLTLAGGKLSASIEEGVLKLDQLNGAIFGGDFKGEARLAAQASGLSLTAKASASGMRLEQIARDAGGKPLAAGPVDLDISVNGSGLSPYGLATGLNGEGKLTFEKGEIAGLAADAPRRTAADFATKPKAESVDEGQMLRAIKGHLQKAPFAYKPFTAGIEIRNGVARIEKARLETGGGRAAVTTFLEFPSLKLDSEWTLFSNGGDSDDADGRQVTLAFAGPLSGLGRIAPEIDTQALRRFVTIHRMEQDVERLEKLKVPGAGKTEADAKAPQGERPQAAPPPLAVQPEPAPEPAPAVPPVQAAPVPEPKPPVAAKPKPAPRPAPLPTPRPALPARDDAVVTRPLPPAAPPPQPGLPWLGPGGPQGAAPVAPPGTATPERPPQQPDVRPPAPPEPVVRPPVARRPPVSRPPATSPDAGVFGTDGG